MNLFGWFKRSKLKREIIVNVEKLETRVAVMENGVIQRWSKSDGLKGTSVRSITEDGDGVIYVGTTSGVSAIFPDGAIRSISASAITNALTVILTPSRRRSSSERKSRQASAM